MTGIRDTLTRIEDILLLNRAMSGAGSPPLTPSGNSTGTPARPRIRDEAPPVEGDRNVRRRGSLPAVLV